MPYCGNGFLPWGNIVESVGTGPEIRTMLGPPVSDRKITTADTIAPLECMRAPRATENPKLCGALYEDG